MNFISITLRINLNDCLNNCSVLSLFFSIHHISYKHFSKIFCSHLKFIKDYFQTNEFFLTSFESKLIFVTTTFTFTQLFSFFPQSTVRKFTFYYVSYESKIMFHPFFISNFNCLLTFLPIYFFFPEVKFEDEKFTLKVVIFLLLMCWFDSDFNLLIFKEKPSLPLKFDCFVPFSHTIIWTLCFILILSPNQLFCFTILKCKHFLIGFMQ